MRHDLALVNGVLGHNGIRTWLCESPLAIRAQVEVKQRSSGPGCDAELSANAMAVLVAAIDSLAHVFHRSCDGRAGMG